jgi:hypothetical protein
MLSGTSYIRLLLNLRSVLAVSCSCSLAINLALYSSLCSISANILSARNRISLVYRLTIPKELLLCKKYRLYID